MMTGATMEAIVVATNDAATDCVGVQPMLPARFVATAMARANTGTSRLEAAACRDAERCTSFARAMPEGERRLDRGLESVRCCAVGEDGVGREGVDRLDGRSRRPGSSPPPTAIPLRRVSAGDGEGAGLWCRLLGVVAAALAAPAPSKLRGLRLGVLVQATDWEGRGAGTVGRLSSVGARPRCGDSPAWSNPASEMLCTTRASSTSSCGVADAWNAARYLLPVRQDKWSAPPVMHRSNNPTHHHQHQRTYPSPPQTELACGPLQCLRSPCSTPHQVSQLQTRP